MFNATVGKAQELKNDQLVHIISGVEEASNRSFEIYIAKEIESILVCVKKNGEGVGLNYNIPLEEIFGPILKHVLNVHSRDAEVITAKGIEVPKEEEVQSEVSEEQKTDETQA